MTGQDSESDPQMGESTYYIKTKKFKVLQRYKNILILFIFNFYFFA